MKLWFSLQTIQKHKISEAEWGNTNDNENIFHLNKNVVNDLMSLPVNPIVIACSTKELEFFEGGGAWEGASNGWVKAQEWMKGSGAF